MNQASACLISGPCEARMVRAATCQALHESDSAFSPLQRYFPRWNTPLAEQLPLVLNLDHFAGPR